MRPLKGLGVSPSNQSFSVIDTPKYSNALQQVTKDPSENSDPGNYINFQIIKTTVYWCVLTKRVGDKEAYESPQPLNVPYYHATLIDYSSPAIPGFMGSF
jgi:hypothetical protein